MGLSEKRRGYNIFEKALSFSFSGVRFFSVVASTVRTTQRFVSGSPILYGIKPFLEDAGLEAVAFDAQGIEEVSSLFFEHLHHGIRCVRDN